MDIVRVGIIGVGNMGSGHAKNIVAGKVEGMTLTAIADINPARLEWAKENCPDATLVFIMPPSMEELERRLRSRGDTPEDQIEVRMERAVWEMEQKSWYDHVVVNDVAQDCAEKILKIIAE